MTTEPLPPAGPAPPADRHGPASATVLVGALLVLVGIGWLLDASGVEVPWRAVLPAALIAVGLACVAGAFRGRQHALMVVGVALTVVLSLAAAADWDLDVPWGGGVGDRTERPTTPADLTGYELGVGNLGVSVQVVASSGLGQVQVFGDEDGGIASRIDASSEQGGDRRLELDARVGLGEVRVEQ
jgi:hypothetical protein